ncbi:transposase [Actinocrinis puniceicyclus]|uniref:Transposase n=1 Tax=Actinocrinis puniceicyclus TaxID=977794 RepID=A0A8J7WMY8_9ACTN|nr:transposase [Actinocrinis puniceicyclus]MBS2962804.1 transposase [Actinocrinis puniceicyclus]
MLPDATLPASLLALLGNLRYVFTAPGFATFAALATGLIANTGAGTVTGMLTGAGLARTWPHDRAHAFFARAAWSSDTLGLYLSRLIVRTLLPAGAALTVAVDDTLPGPGTTDLHSTPATLVSRYAWRWSTEVTFAEARQELGAGQARNRIQLAVERTTPFALYCHTIVVIWYTLHGHHPADAAERRERQPWYTSKAEPAFADMAAELRRTTIAARFTANAPLKPTDAEIRAVQQAWAQAGLDHAA